MKADLDPSTALNRSHVVDAHQRIRPFIHCTPIFTSRQLDSASGCTVFLKCENFQKVGAFKARGAVNAVLSLSAAQLAHGVATHSSGNHGAALAYAAQLRSVPSYVVMPSNAPAVKRAAVLSYGAEVIPCEPTLVARETTLAEVVARTHATEIHPYETPAVICGQGTVALELAEQVPDLDVMMAPVGGGGLLSGVALAAPAQIRVVGVEPSAVDDAFRSLSTGVHAPAPSGVTLADGLRTRLGGRAFSILSAYGVQIETVTEEQIIVAMRFVWERMKLLIEPSSAVPIAALLDGRLRNQRVGVVISGGNVDLASLPF